MMQKNVGGVGDLVQKNVGGLRRDRLERYFYVLKFIGYRVLHNYRAENNLGNTLIGNTVFIIDESFENVLFSCDLEEYNSIQKSIKDFEEALEE